MIEWYAAELTSKDLCNSWLLGKARSLPMCRRSILTAKIIMWNEYITTICNSIFYDRKIDYRDVNKECKDYLLSHQLASSNFVDFFFAFHEPIALRFQSQLQHSVESGMDKKTKITTILYVYKELMNLTRIELECFEINCEVLGNKDYICKTHECKNQPNVITLMLTPEYIEDDKVIDGIVTVLKNYITKKNIITLVIDYRNLCDYYEGVYSWEKTGAYRRYRVVKEFVKEIYFYKFGCVDFGRYRYEVDKHLIYDKRELEKKVYRRKS